MPKRARRGLALAAVFSVALLVTVSSAAAAQRFAAPTGSGAGCTSAAPCSIETAFSGAIDGDEIILSTGEYGPVSSILSLPSNGSAHGVQGQPAPRIHFASGNYLLLTPASRASYLQVDGVTPAPLQVDQPDAVADQVLSQASGNGACIVFGRLIDSVCWTSAPGYPAFEAVANGNFSPTLRNVTLEATGADGTGLSIRAGGSGTLAASATNVIVHGAGTRDLDIEATLPAHATLAIDHSNYLNPFQSGTGAQITQTNQQTAAPLFVNPATGDFHQATGSPTIDAGVAADLMGSADIDGDARTIGAAPDIGADEFVPGPTTSATTPSTCKGKTATIVGDDGPNILSGTPAADVIAALGGNDKVSGLAGNDTICGGSGKDTLKGGAGNDFLGGQKGNDKLYGQKGNDKLSGKAGKDTLKGGPGKDKLKGGAGKDKQIQ
jgi:Ca2+-binding RTX toxin-like protein